MTILRIKTTSNKLPKIEALIRLLGFNAEDWARFVARAEETDEWIEITIKTVRFIHVAAILDALEIEFTSEEA